MEFFRIEACCVGWVLEACLVGLEVVYVLRFFYGIFRFYELESFFGIMLGFFVWFIVYGSFRCFYRGICIFIVLD